MKTKKMIVYFKVDEFEKCCEFASKILGFVSFKKSGNCEIFLDDSGISGLGYCRAQGEDTASGGCLVSFAVEDVDGLYLKFKEAGYAITEPKESAKHGVYHFYAADPAGNTLELMRFV